ncbi:RNA cap guanine-N2 methyltransferase-domain-containing protein [Schizophyllum fasciatum]
MGQKRRTRGSVHGVAALLKNLGGSEILAVKEEIGDKNHTSYLQSQQTEHPSKAESSPSSSSPSPSRSDLGFVDAQRRPGEVIDASSPAPAGPSHSTQQQGQACQNPTTERPTKRRKTLHDTTSAPASKWAKKYGKAWIDKYDASGLVPYYKSKAEVPEELAKYFSQRMRYFSLYSEPPGCLLDTEGWYSITPEAIANQIAERCRCDTILDAFCGVGGNAIAFAQTCQRVIALDTDPTRLALARHNAQIYGVADRIEFILTDYVAFAEAYINRASASSASTVRMIDVVFLSPPWGGPSYLQGTSRPASPVKNGSTAALATDAVDEHPTYSLSSIRPIPGDELFRLTRKISRNVAYYIPRNTDVAEIGALLENEDALSSIEQGQKVYPKKGKVQTTSQGEGRTRKQSEKVEVEEEWMGNKLKALTCYFGGLAAGQEHLFDAP